MSNGDVERRVLEFIIAGIVPSGKGRLTLIGRNGDSSIRLGDTFETAFRYKPRKYPEEMGDDLVKLDEKPVSLIVVGIEAYQRQLQSLGEGMTGAIVVEGEGIGSVGPGWVLGSVSPQVVANHGVKTVPAVKGVTD